MNTSDTVSVLFVCLGNICRSPTAHGVFAAKLNAMGLADRVTVDSAGTAGWHVGTAPDERATEEASVRGYALGHLRARQAEPEDFMRFNYVLAMDNDNLANLNAIAPADYPAHLGLFLEFAPTQPLREVPDPYYGGQQGFAEVLDLVELACDGLLEQVCRDLGVTYDAGA